MVLWGDGLVKVTCLFDCLGGDLVMFRGSVKAQALKKYLLMKMTMTAYDVNAQIYGDVRHLSNTKKVERVINFMCLNNC